MNLNRRLLPSVSGLVAFESAARHGSITAAASELNLTQSAVSRQIQQLEVFLDVNLFERVHQRVQLTSTGRAYLADVAKILNDLGAATQRTITAAGAHCNLSLAVLPMFATRWLVPRLQSFLASHTDLMLNVSVRTGPFDFAADSIDAAIHYGGRNWPGGISHFLMEEILVPVCNPFFRDRNNLRTPEDIAQVTLLRETNRLWAWPDWFRRHGINKAHASHGPCFDQELMLSQAALSGLGVALLPKFIVADELASGALVQPVKHDLLTEGAYYLVVPESKSRAPIIVSFRNWLVRQTVPFRSVKNTIRENDLSDRANCQPRDHRRSSKVPQDWERVASGLQIANVR